jgi:Tol biopolymer transport system component
MRTAIFVALATTAAAQEGIRRPERLTSGVSDQLLGQLSGDGKVLYYVSNRNTTVEIYRQELLGRPALLFDEGADATWPRLSPDGKRILYISYRDDAGGRLCVRDLPDKHRRCLGGGSALQAQWIDATHILLVSRDSLDADLTVSQVKLGWLGLSEQRLFQRNLSSPTLSPDGKWLIYVPLQRYLPRVGPAIASRAAERLEAVRLDHPDKPLALAPDLPGLSGQPAFSADGKHLYFTQFFNDSNQDGEIDASDNGVLFRLPFDAGSGVTAAVPQQLTDASWNCQYPSPAAKLLIATCSRKNSLDIYSLPLDGQVPGDWGAERLDLEVDLASRNVEELLLDRRLLELQKDVGGRRQVLMNLLTRHLAASEFAAAEFYAKRIRSMPDPTTAGAASALLTLVQHRQAIRDRERGRIALEFLEDSRKRLESLSLEKTKAPAAILLRRVVRSEIADAMGDKDLARSELEAAPVDEVPLAPFLEAYHQRAEALYRELDDRDALFQANARLAAHPGLDADDRLGYARAAARALTRGLPWDEAVKRLESQPAPAGSELEFACKLQSIVLTVRDENPSHELRARLVDFYKQQPRLGRKRAVMLDAMQRAVDLEAEKLVEALAKLYLEDTPAGSGERTRAQRLYERAMLGRAYRRLARGDVARAREVFGDLANAGSLEAHLGYVELRLREGATSAQLTGEYQGKPAAGIVQAYLMGRELPSLGGEAHERAAQAALDELRRSPLHGELAAEVLHGELHHERYLVSHDLNAAQRANIHYLLALELAPRNPRYLARILQQLALLQMQVGNYRIALDYAEERDKMPHSSSAAALAQLLVHARILFHLDRLPEAGKLAAEALQMVERTPALAAHLPLVLDRAALYALGADRFDHAASLYDREAPLVSDKNRLVLGLARAAAALGDQKPQAALSELDRVDAWLADSSLALEWPHFAPDEVRRSYRLIAAGLRANAQLLLGNSDAAAVALATRQSLAQERFAKSDSDEHLRQLALVEARLASLAKKSHRRDEALRWLEAALGHADDYVRRTGVKLHADQLDLLRLAAELSLEGTNSPRVILPQRLRQALDQLVSERDPAFRAQQRWLETLSAMFP